MAFIEAGRRWARALLARARRAGERGATAVEYAMVAGAIAAIIVTAVLIVGQNTMSNYECTETSIRTTTEAC